MWSIEVQLDGCPIPYELCKCDTPESVSAVVLALCRSRETRPLTLKRIAPTPPTEPEGMGAFAAAD